MSARCLTFPLALLLAFAPLAGCGPGDGAAAEAALRSQAPPGSVTVMTRNLYLGADLVAPLGEEDPTAAAAQAWADILASDPAARMAAIADEIALVHPDLIGLQEAPRFEVTPIGTTTPQAIDFLDLLDAALATRGLTYQRAAVQPHTVLTVPVPDVGLVTFIDRDAILADQDVTILSSGGGDFTVPYPPIPSPVPIDLKRGWAEVEAEHDGVTFTFVDAHLEVKEFESIQGLQALELAATFATAFPLVLVGDMNSDPRDGPIPLPDPPGGSVPSPYMTFTSDTGLGLADAWPGVGGFTCCFNADLSVPASPLFERVDLILASEGFGPTFTYRTGFQQLPGLAAASPPEEIPRWPSDHAGVVSFLGTSQLTPPEELAAK